MLVLALLAAAATPGDGKTMAPDDWHTLAIYGVGAEANGPLYLQAHAGDLDGDGLPDDAVLKLVCSDSKLTNASYVLAPRDSASGMATGKRMHKPILTVKEWGAASPQLREGKLSYNIKELKGARTAADGWTEIGLSNAAGLCPAAQAAAAAIVKSKSNITNN